MAIERWNPSRTYTRQETFLLKRLRRTRKLFAFLRDHRHEIFDDAMQAQLESMYRDTGAGKDPVCPSVLAMAVLMQGYLGVSDAEAVELTVVDLRWQMVLGCLGSTEPAFSQGAFQQFRERMIRCDMDSHDINSPVVDRVLDRGGEIFCRPWAAKNGKLFAKSRFDINIRIRTIACPAGHTERIVFGTTVEIDPEHCDPCPLRNQCTETSLGHGRTVAIAENEPLQKRLRKLAATPAGRTRLRRRVAVEHALAHAGRRQGRRARYRGIRKNLYDWRRACAITNLETIHRALGYQRARKAA